MALIDQGGTTPERNCKRLVILGSSKVGKTSIASRFLENKYDDTYTPTVENYHRKVYDICGKIYKLDILDTSGNHPFPAMRRMSYITGDLFILVYSVGCRDSFDEVSKIHHQIMKCRNHNRSVRDQKINKTPIIVVGNKCDRENDRKIHKSEAFSLIKDEPFCDFLESSAKKNINIEEIFQKLFYLAKLPTEMSPGIHRRVTLSNIGGDIRSKGRHSIVSTRHKMGDARGAVALNVRRPSLGTDLRIAHQRASIKKRSILEMKDNICSIQ